jgi:hypothetical protein
VGVKELKEVFRVRVGGVREEEGKKSEGELERVKKEKGKWLSE